MMSLPKVIPSGVKVKSVVRSIDIAPTILDILGIQREEQFEGESLFPAILDPAQGTDRTVFMERRHYAETLYQGVSVLGSKFGVREGNMKYVWAPEELTEELFDLTRDPSEKDNIADRNPELSSCLQDMIKDWKEQQGFEAPAQSIDEETQKKLKALGYVN